jgi:hypothetical protein
MLAQEKPPASPYRVEFTIQDANDTSAKNARHYTMQIDNANGRGSIRSGSKVAYPTAMSMGATGQPIPTTYSYADVGVNVDCRLTEKDGQLNLWTSVDLSAVTDTKGTVPLIGQTRGEVSTVVTPGKQATLLLIDDPQIQKRVRVDALVSPMK